MGLRTIAEMDGFSICRRTTINMKSSGMKSAMAQADRILLRSSPSENTSPEMGILLGHALAMDNRKVVVGRDLMRSSSMMKEALVAGLTSSGANVLDVGVVSCPALALAASKGDCAVYVTEYRGYGMTSGYLLVNPNGSLFRKEQLRHLEMYLVDPPKLPESGGLGHVYEVYGAVDEYNARLRSLPPEKAECSVVMDCNCGPVSDSAPQILNSMGVDVLTLNAQRDLDYVSGEMDSHGIRSDNVQRQVQSESGYIGCAMNKAGTMTSVLDENGRELKPDEVFALTVMFLRPKSIAVPIDTSTLIEDAFYGRLSEDQPQVDSDGYVMTSKNAAAVCEAVASGAELGFYDGGIIYRDISMMPDGIRTAAVMAGIAGDKSINKMVGTFPEYLRSRSVRDFSAAPEAFKREMDERLPGMEGRTLVRDYAWRVDLEGGWFLVRLIKTPGPAIEIVAESKDRAYVIGLVEIAGDLVDECLKAL